MIIIKILQLKVENMPTIYNNQQNKTIFNLTILSTLTGSTAFIEKLNAIENI